jgi:hypothetical protein
LLQVALVAVSFVLVWDVLRCICASGAAALVALAAISLYLPLWDFDRTILSEALATPLAIMVTWALVKERFLLAGLAAALLGLTKVSAAATAVAVALVSAHVIWRRQRRWDAAVKAFALPLAVAVSGQLLWFSYGSAVIPGFTMMPANGEYSAYANARYCGYSLEPELPGADHLVHLASGTVRRAPGPRSEFFTRTFGYRTFAEFNALVAASSPERVGAASRQVQADDPLRLLGCSAAKVVRTVTEEVLSYPTLDASFDAVPSALGDLRSWMRRMAIAVAPWLSATGLLGLVAGAALGARYAGRLLTLCCVQLAWLGLFAAGDAELFRLRAPIDVVLLAGIPLSAGALWMPVQGWAAARLGARRAARQRLTPTPECAGPVTQAIPR